MIDDLSGIWLKVSNARLEAERVEIQLEGDRADREPVWWPVASNASGDDPVATFRTISEGLDKKRTVLAKLQALLAAPAGKAPSAQDRDALEAEFGRAIDDLALGCRLLRIQHTESRLS